MDISKYIDRQIANERDAAISALETLSAEALKARDAIVAGERPFMMMNGSLGIERSVADADRHTYTWLQMHQLKGATER